MTYCHRSMQPCFFPSYYAVLLMTLLAVSKLRASNLNLAYMAVFLPLPCSYSHILDIAVLLELKTLLVNISINGKSEKENGYMVSYNAKRRD